MLRWDPAVLLDSHTHNGSYHEEFVTYVWSLNPNGDTALIRYMSDVARLGIDSILKEKYNIKSIPHGDFMSIKEPEKGWRPLGPQPRYLSNYFGLRNRLGILNENYPYADFKTRVAGAYHLFHALLEYCENSRDEIQKLIRTADENTVRRGLSPRRDDQFIPLNMMCRPIKDKITVNGYVMEQYQLKADGRVRAEPTKLRLTPCLFLAEFFAKRSVPLPFGYLIPVPAPEAELNCCSMGSWSKNSHNLEN